MYWGFAHTADISINVVTNTVFYLYLRLLAWPQMTYKRLSVGIPLALSCTSLYLSQLQTGKTIQQDTACYIEKGTTYIGTAESC